MTIRSTPEKEILYESEKMVITYFPSKDVYTLSIGVPTLFLDDRILDDLAKTRDKDLKGKLSAISPDIDCILERMGLSYAEVGLALAQARIKELEDELSQAYTEQRVRRGFV